MAAEINNVAYSWSMIQLQTNFDGESAQAPIFVDCTAIKWDTKRKIESIIVFATSYCSIVCE